MKQTFLSVIIPAYNESKRISFTLLRLDEYFKNKNYDYEIIVVNDGSPDNLAEVVQNYLGKIKNLRLLSYQINKGKGYAVKTGMMNANGEYKLFMDADNSVDIMHLDKFLEQAQNGSDIVIGSIELLKEGSVKKENNGFLRRFLGKLSKKPIQILVTPGIKDTQRGFKLFSKEASEITFSKQTIFRFAFDIELLVIALANKLKIKEMPVVFDNPVGSTVSLSSYFYSLKDLGIILLRKFQGKYNPERLEKKQYPYTGFAKLIPLTILLLFIATVLMVENKDIIKTKYQNALTSITKKDAGIGPDKYENFNPETDPVKNIYSKIPLNKNQFGTMMILSLLLGLLGFELVAGLANNAVNKYLINQKKIASKYSIKNSLASGLKNIKQ